MKCSNACNQIACVCSIYSEVHRCMCAGEILQLVGDRLSVDVHLSVLLHPR